MKINLDKKHILKITIFSLVIIGVLLFDQLSKVYTIGIPEANRVIFIPGVISFFGVKNTGAAWSLFAGQQTFLIVLTFVLLALLSFYIFKNKHKSILFMVSTGLIFAGGIGNLIDRLCFGYVRDFINLDFMNFPVFNIADMSLVIGVICLIVYLIFMLPKLEKNKNGEVK